jgi:hypothetical protein
MESQSIALPLGYARLHECNIFVHIGRANNVANRQSRKAYNTQKIARYLSQVYREVLSNVKSIAQHYLNLNASRITKTFGSF